MHLENGFLNLSLAVPMTKEDIVHFLNLLDLPFFLNREEKPWSLGPYKMCSLHWEPLCLQCHTDC